MKLATHLDRATVQVIPMPVYSHSMSNGFVLCWLQLLLDNLDGIVVVDHGHRSSKLESHICFVLKPLVGGSADFGKPRASAEAPAAATRAARAASLTHTIAAAAPAWRTDVAAALPVSECAAPSSPSATARRLLAAAARLGAERAAPSCRPLQHLQLGGRVRGWHS